MSLRSGLRVQVRMGRARVRTFAGPVLRLKMFSETLRPEPQADLTAGSRAEPRPGGREGRIPRR